MIATPSIERARACDRRSCRSLLRRFPPGMRQDIAKIHNDGMRLQLAEVIMGKALEVARERGLIITDPCRLEPPATLPPVHLRTILRELDGSQSFRNWLRKDVRDLLRHAHLRRVDPARERACTLREPRASNPPECGPWEVQADVGLGTASFLDGEPEGWDVWVARQLLALHEGYTDPFRVCVLGAGAGGIARALDALAPGDKRVFIHEVDWVVDSATELPTLERDQHGAPIPDPRVSGRNLACGWFESVVMVLPPPSLGVGANQRGIYIDIHSADHRPRDLGWFGPRRWKANAKYWLDYFASLLALAPGAIGYALLPFGIREGRSYRVQGDLLDGLLQHAGTLGLRVKRKIQTVEVGSAHQPFVGTNRCPRLTVIFERVVEDNFGELFL